MKKLFLLITITILSINLAEATIPVANVPGVVADALAQVSRLKQLKEEIDTARNTVKNVQKIFGSDQVFQNLANMALASASQETINWASSGFDGGPAFIQNPNVFFKNKETEVTRTNLASISASNNSNSSAVANSLVSITRYNQQSLGQSIEPSFPFAVQTYTCSEAGLTKLAEEQMSKSSISINGPQSLDSIKADLRTRLCSTSPANNISLQKDLTACAAGSFYCGGWKSFLNLTSDPKNNKNSAIMLANIKNEKDKAAKLENEKLVNKDGILANTECVDSTINGTNYGSTGGAAGVAYNTCINNGGTAESCQSVFDAYTNGNVAVNDPNIAPCEKIIKTPAPFVSNTITTATNSGTNRAAASTGEGGFDVNSFNSLLSGTITGGLLSSAYSNSGSNSSGQILTLDTLSDIQIGSNGAITSNPSTTVDTNTQIVSAPITDESGSSAILSINNGIGSGTRKLNSLKTTVNDYLNNYIKPARAEIVQLNQCVDGGKSNLINKIQNPSAPSPAVVLSTSQLNTIDTNFNNLAKVISFRSFASSTDDAFISKKSELNNYLSKIDILLPRITSTQNSITTAAQTSILEANTIFQIYTNENIKNGYNDLLDGTLELDLQAEYSDNKSNLGNTSSNDPNIYGGTADPTAVKIKECTAYMFTLTKNDVLPVTP